MKIRSMLTLVLIMASQIALAKSEVKTFLCESYSSADVNERPNYAGVIVQQNELGSVYEVRSSLTTFGSKLIYKGSDDIINIKETEKLIISNVFTPDSSTDGAKELMLESCIRANSNKEINQTKFVVALSETEFACLANCLDVTKTYKQPGAR